MRCDKCKHWLAADLDGRGWSSLFGTCCRIKHPEDIRFAALADESGDTWERRKQREHATMRIELAYVMDCSCYSASLHTKPDFFCACFTELQVE